MAVEVMGGTTDAKDNCEGIMNAYLAADCGTIRKSGSSSKKDTTIYNMDDDFNDDYFGDHRVREAVHDDDQYYIALAKTGYMGKAGYRVHGVPYDAYKYKAAKARLARL